LVAAADATNEQRQTDRWTVPSRKAPAFAAGA